MPALEWVEASGEVSSFQAPQVGGLGVSPSFLWGGGVGRTGSRQDTAVLPPNAPPESIDNTLSQYINSGSPGMPGQSCQYIAVRLAIYTKRRTQREGLNENAASGLCGNRAPRDRRRYRRLISFRRPHLSRRPEPHRLPGHGHDRQRLLRWLGNMLRRGRRWHQRNGCRHHRQLPDGSSKQRRPQPNF